MTLQDRAKNAIFEYVVKSINEDSDIKVGLEDLYVIRFYKVLQNWKAIIMTKIPDGRIYDVTYSGDSGTTYVNVYDKIDSFEINESK